MEESLQSFLNDALTKGFETPDKLRERQLDIFKKIANAKL
jgi:hypothetical protein